MTDGERKAGRAMADRMPVEEIEQYRAHLNEYGELGADTVAAVLDALEAANREVDNLQNKLTPTAGYAAKCLLAAMRDASESYMCAGWEIGLEYSLWFTIHTPHGRGWFAYRCMPLDERETLRELAAGAGGWWVWSEGEKQERFISLAEWHPMFAAWVERNGEGIRKTS